MPQRLLALYAHPDDEILGPGGTIALYARDGVAVELVCATRGEAGEISNPALATPEQLGAVREQELLCSAAKLGIRRVHFLGYRDSGMAGTAANGNPDAFVNAPSTAVVARLVEIIRAFRPQVLLTFEPWGGYGHPDHIAINRHTLAAFERAGDPDYRPELGAPWQPRRLFYPFTQRRIFDHIKRALVANGHDVSNLEAWEALRAKAWPDDKVNCIVDISATLDHKWEAFRCHATQFGPDNLFVRLPREEMRSIFRRETFALARPLPPADLMLDGLFDGLDT